MPAKDDAVVSLSPDPLPLTPLPGTLLDGVAREQRERLESIDGELEEVKNQLGRVWHFIARSDSVDVAEASDLIVELRERKEKLEIATEEARALLKERRQFLDSRRHHRRLRRRDERLPQDQRAD